MSKSRLQARSVLMLVKPASYVHPLTLSFANPSESEVQSASRMRFGRARVHKPKSAQDEDAVDFVDASSMTELHVAAGDVEAAALPEEWCSLSEGERKVLPSGRWIGAGAGVAC